MPYARMQQIIGSAVEWAANDLILGYGEIAVERVNATDIRLKVGDGTSKFSATPYITSFAGGVAWENIVGKPATYPPGAHSHAPSEITDLVDASGKISITLIPPTLLERMNWRGLHTPTAGQEYPLAPAAGDTWGIAGAAYTFTTGPLTGRVVSEGSAITYDAGTWFALGGGGAGINSADYVAKADLITVSTGPTDAGKVAKTNTAGVFDPSLFNVPGALNFRGTVDITQPPPVGLNQGDYWLCGIGGVAHVGWTGIAGTTLAVNDMVLWNGVIWTYTHTAGAATGFVPIDGSAPMTGPLALSANPSPAPAHAVRQDRVTAQIAAIPSAITQLGFTPLNPANNLSELTDDALARTNLGLGTMATAAAVDFLTKADNLASLLDKGLSRTNLGLGSAATRADAYFLQTSQNLADVPDKALARSNLGVPNLSDIILKSTVDAAGDLIMGTADNTVARLPVGSANYPLVSTGSGLRWGGAVTTTGDIYSDASINGAGGLVTGSTAGVYYGASGNAFGLHRNGQQFYINQNAGTYLPFPFSHNVSRVSIESGGGGALNVSAGFIDSAGTSTYYVQMQFTSDRRIKTGIADTEIDALKILQSIPVRKFTIPGAMVAALKPRSIDAQTGTPEAIPPQPDHAIPIGLVAQEVGAHIPEMVSVMPAAPNKDSVLPDDLQTIVQERAVPYLIRAIQQLAARVGALEMR